MSSVLERWTVAYVRVVVGVKAVILQRTDPGALSWREMARVENGSVPEETAIREGWLGWSQVTGLRSDIVVLG